ncbi:hypothetical protein KFK09_001272 [Dendrobium nobile]|uniref:Uncharacterized protein n=1 Tax=Dendrobium nobile TaxID=94219 RepID=A0A8T3C4H5_DENNO|nr:hypothetical protein KFK09_001272 [Dendrobium nobile]
MLFSFFLGISSAIYRAITPIILVYLAWMIKVLSRSISSLTVSLFFLYSDFITFTLRLLVYWWQEVWPEIIHHTKHDSTTILCKMLEEEFIYLCNLILYHPLMLIPFYGHKYHMHELPLFLGVLRSEVLMDNDCA